MIHTHSVPMGPIRDWDDAIRELGAMVIGIDDLVDMMTTATGVTVGIDTSELDSLKTQIQSTIDRIHAELPHWRDLCLWEQIDRLEITQRRTKSQHVMLDVLRYIRDQIRASQIETLDGILHDDCEHES